MLTVYFTENVRTSREVRQILPSIRQENAYVQRFILLFVNPELAWTFFANFNVPFNCLLPALVVKKATICGICFMRILDFGNVRLKAICLNKLYIFLNF
jgi:hypothetical protein